jgi:hypothetical protein
MQITWKFGVSVENNAAGYTTLIKLTLPPVSQIN